MKTEALVLFMKAPVPGHCKTRLVPPLNHGEAAKLYRAFCQDIVGSVKTLNVDVWITYQPSFQYPTPDWANPQSSPLPTFHQNGKTLGDRLIHAFETLFRKNYQRVAAIGTDAPQLSPADIDSSFDLLKGQDAIFGPARDGGYYLVGLSRFIPGLFQEIPWSTDQVLKKTKEILERENIGASFLPEHYDVDSSQDLMALAWDMKDENIAYRCPRTKAALAGLQEKVSRGGTNV